MSTTCEFCFGDPLHNSGKAAVAESGWVVRCIFGANSAAIGEKNNAAVLPSPLRSQTAGSYAEGP